MRIGMVVGLLLVLVAGCWWFTVRAAGLDRELPVYVNAGERMAAGEEIYRPVADQKPFTYPPFFAAPFVPFAMLPPAVQPAAWFALNLAALVAILAFLQRWWRATGNHVTPRRTVWFWLLVALLAGRHVASVFENQSHDLLIAGAVALAAAAWCNGGRLAGAWAGLGAACKATPLLFLLLFAWRRRWATLLSMLGAVALLTWLPDLLFARADGRSFCVAWYEINLRGLAVAGPTSGVWGPLSYLNQSLTGTLTRLCTPVAETSTFVEPGVAIASLSVAGVRIVTGAAMLLVVVAMALGLRARPAAAQDPASQRSLGLGEVSLVLCGMLLLSPQSSKSHFCVLLLPAAFCVQRLLRRRSQPLLWLLLALATLLGTAMSKGLVGRDIGNRMLAYGNVTWSTVCMLLATIVAMRQPAERPSTNSTMAT